MILSLTVAVLVAGGVYLLLQRSMVRAVFGMTLISHAANFVLLATGVPGWRAEPLTDVSSRADMADPLPQAFVLTAIVITMAVTIFMLTLAVIGRDDDMSQHPATGENPDS
ncbi:MAG: sodium:proton antiporter [Brachybacterium tyrofermentans]|uniref:Sodium:proton antiporter n=1 Tax=Brachybacterium tyrofermentans TaxID=47848 RepID=A0ABW0FGD4_9MICO|nr:cation:proton antiporter subunit C [Brachybacterium tyrofermentans]SLN03915.1 Na(+) H(+) antiporter subunit C [Corynebacterium xerosis]